MSKTRPKPLPRQAADPVSSFLENGGASRDRTDDLKLAKLALSQLSYGPTPVRKFTDVRTDEQAILPQVVGREGVEPSTSRLSGVRSNHLSYRPPCLAGQEAAGGVSQLRLRLNQEAFPAMKGHEDGGMFFGQEEECVSSSIRRDP